MLSACLQCCMASQISGTASVLIRPGSACQAAVVSRTSFSVARSFLAPLLFCRSLLLALAFLLLESLFWLGVLRAEKAATLYCCQACSLSNVSVE